MSFIISVIYINTHTHTHTHTHNPPAFLSIFFNVQCGCLDNNSIRKKQEKYNASVTNLTI
jgi:hypothetical protein